MPSMGLDFLNFYDWTEIMIKSNEPGGLGLGWLVYQCPLGELLIEPVQLNPIQATPSQRSDFGVTIQGATD